MYTTHLRPVSHSQYKHVNHGLSLTKVWAHVVNLVTFKGVSGSAAGDSCEIKFKEKLALFIGFTIQFKPIRCMYFIQQGLGFRRSPPTSSSGVRCLELYLDSLFIKFYNKESVSKSGKHTNISKRQHWHTPTSIVRGIHSPTPTKQHARTHCYTLSHTCTHAPSHL